MAKFEDEGETKLGMVMNVLSPVIWAFLGFFIFNFISTRVSQFSENFDNTFMYNKKRSYMNNLNNEITTYINSWEECSRCGYMCKFSKLICTNEDTLICDECNLEDM